MYTDSRKAQRDRYTHHRAELLFSKPTDKPASRRKDIEPQFARERIRAGLIGFVSAIATASS